MGDAGGEGGGTVPPEGDGLNALAWFRRSALHAANGRDADAVRCADRALSLDPSLRAARWNRGVCLLRLGRWREAWPDWESGIGIGAREQRPWPQRWGGVSSVVGKRVYLWGEQGLGDTIMCLRFVAPFRERFRPGRVIVEVQPSLVRIAQGLAGADEVVCKRARHEPATAFDVHASLYSLPAFLGVSPEDV